MTAVEVLQYAAERGVTLGLRGRDRIVVRGPSGVVESLKPKLAARKLELVAELRSRQAQPHDDAPCDCKSFGEHYDLGGSYDGWRARIERDRGARLGEWHVDCPVFVTVANANELAACLACGGTWELHGSPARELWRVASDTEAVETLAVRFVLVAKARTIAQPGNQP